MKKGLYLLIGIFALMFLFSNFVSAGYCLGNIDCTGFGSNPTPPSYSTCQYLESENYCEWHDYSSCSFYDEYDCEMYDCTWDYYMEVCTSSNGECWPGYNNVDSCNNFDYSEYACEKYPGCTWESGCLNDADCGSGQYCSGESLYCSGTYLDTSKKIGPGTPNDGDDSLYRQMEGGVPKLCTLEYDQFDNPWYNCIWEEDIMYINFDGSSYDSCGICSDAGNLGYIVDGSTWNVHWCVEKTPLIFGQCVWGSRWSDNYDTLGSGYMTINCGSSTCDLYSSCSWNIASYGTCQTSCVAETNTAFCSRLGKECGSVTANDNCGDSRTVNCGTCTSPEICSSGVCGCTAETNAVFCSRLGKECGSVTANDNCGDLRTVTSCGTCTSPEICSGGVCGCTAETNAVFCSRLGKECGSVTANDNCGDSRTITSCGTCTSPEICSGGVCGCTAETCASLGIYNCGIWNDGCGGTVNCGTCTLPEICSSGLCECIADCDDKECGSDGCGGICNGVDNGMSQDCIAIYGDCLAYDGKETCVGTVFSLCSGTDPRIETCEAPVNCGDDLCGDVCGLCNLGEECTDGVCTCVPDCAGKECGDDGCGGGCNGYASGDIREGCTANRGTCIVTGYETCGTTSWSPCLVTDPRIANCDGLECGSDLCGGTCPPGCAVGDVCKYDQTACVTPNIYWAENTLLEKPTANPLSSPIIPYTIKAIMKDSGLSPDTVVTFDILEEDNSIPFDMGDDDIWTGTAVVDANGKAVIEFKVDSSNLTSGTKGAEENSIDNTEFEFYFEVEGFESEDLLFTYDLDLCIGVTLCSQYNSFPNPEADCWADSCGANATECLDYFCRCEWDDVGGTCNQVGYEEPDIFTNLCVWCIDDVDTRGTWCDMPEGTNDYCDTAEAGCGVGDSITNSIYCDAIDFTIGSCTYLTDDSGDLDGCEDDGYLTYTWGARWGWNEVVNAFLPPDPDPDGSDFLEDPLGTWRYDPTLLSVDCNAKGGTNSAICPAQIELPFFGTWGIIITIGLIVLIYVVLNLKKKKVVAKKKGKKK